METMKTYILGFPLIIVNPKWREMCGERVLDVDFEKVAEDIFPLVLNKPARLTGGEIRFIRERLKMTQNEFADMMGLANHSIVSQWEKKRDEPTKMNLHTEAIIRIKATQLSNLRVSEELIIKVFDEVKGKEDSGEPLRYKVA